ncbi:MAG: hypothetical protein QOK28_2977 [Actinomycetota bacterium]|jgi:hypothetical protein
MTLGTSTVLVAAGAILRYAVSYQGKGFDIRMIGTILMIAGVAGAILSFILMASSRNDVAAQGASNTTVVETERVD